MEEYLTVKELSQRIKLAVQTIYNSIHEGKFILGKHYLKPTPKKILFKWSEVKEWMGEGRETADQATADLVPGNEAIFERPTIIQKSKKPSLRKSLINI